MEGDQKNLWKGPSTTGTDQESLTHEHCASEGMSDNKGRNLTLHYLCKLSLIVGPQFSEDESRSQNENGAQMETKLFFLP
jgi:hypothetical protein